VSTFLALVLCAFELHGRLEAAGLQITVHLSVVSPFQPCVVCTLVAFSKY
jgi:hypothetical protein